MRGKTKQKWQMVAMLACVAAAIPVTLTISTYGPMTEYPDMPAGVSRVKQAMHLGGKTYIRMFKQELYYFKKGMEHDKKAVSFLTQGNHAGFEKERKEMAEAFDLARVCFYSRRRFKPPYMDKWKESALILYLLRYQINGNTFESWTILDSPSHFKELLAYAKAYETRSMNDVPHLLRKDFKESIGAYKTFLESRITKPQKEGVIIE